MSINDLKELHELKKQGIISEEEFESQKKRILRGLEGNTAPAAKTASAPITNPLSKFGEFRIQSMMPVLVCILSSLSFFGLFLILFHSDADQFFMKFFLVIGFITLIAGIALQANIHVQTWRSLPEHLRVISPEKAFTFLLIPLFSLYWVFPSFYGLAKQLNRLSGANAIGRRKVNEELFALFGVMSAALFLVIFTVDLGPMWLNLRVFAYNFEIIYYVLAVWAIIGLLVTHQEFSNLPRTELASDSNAGEANSSGTEASQEPIYLAIQSSTIPDFLNANNIRIATGIFSILVPLFLFYFSPTLHIAHSITRVGMMVYGILMLAKPSVALVVLAAAAVTNVCVMLFYVIFRSYLQLEPEKYVPFDTIVLPVVQILLLVFLHKNEFSDADTIGIKSKLGLLKAKLNVKKLVLGSIAIATIVAASYALINFVNWRSNFLRLKSYAQIHSKDGMVLRHGPSLNDKAIVTIKYGHFVYVKAESDNMKPFFGIKSKWYLVEYKGKSGWMWGGLSENAALPEENAPVIGLTPSGPKIIPTEVTDSGHLEPQSYKYLPQQTLDGRSDTTWADGKYGAPGIGEWINYAFKEPVNIKMFGILNGLHRPTTPGYNDSYLMNTSPKTIEIQLSNGYTQKLVLDRTREIQYFKFPEQTGVKTVKITILSEYPGIAYQDTCISEVEFY